MRSFAAWAAIPVLGLLYACTNTVITTTTHGNGAAAEDAGAEDLDAGAVVVADAGKADAGKKDSGAPPAVTGPAPIPLVTYNGGSILDAVQIVTVTFDTDVARTLVESWGDTIATTKWWDAVRDGYCDQRPKCIGPGTGGVHVHLPAAAALGSYDDTTTTGASAIKTFIDGYVTSGTFPAPTPNTLYFIYFPSTTTITLDGSASCSTFGGYHSSMTATKNAVQFPYAIMPRCSGDTSYLTFAASHELIEAATDPFISPDPKVGYTGYGSSTDAWDVISGGEVGDRCVSLTGDNSDRYQEGDFVVQRTFSNTAAKGGHDPCVPAPAPSTQPYFALAPKGGDSFGITVGAAGTLEVDAFTDSPISAMSIAVQEVTASLPNAGGPNVLTVSLDQASISPGSKTTLNVTMNSAPAGGQAVIVLSATYENVTHYWPVTFAPQ